MKTPTLTLSLLSVMMLAATSLFTASDSLAAAKHGSYTREFSLYTNVSESHPEVIYLHQPTYVETMDVNWRGANGSSAVMARIYADGSEVWSGMIPAYDPTFRATVRRVVSELEIRVDRGSAYVNWAKLFLTDTVGGGFQPGYPSDSQSPAFIGSITDADQLARQMVLALRSLQEKTSPEVIRASILPLKKAASKVFAVANASGNLHQNNVYAAVIGLENEFGLQETFINSLLDDNSTYEEGLSLMTIRERYKALFGSVHY